VAGQVPNVCAGPFGAFYDFYMAADLCPKMLRRVDLFLSYSGLHMIPEPGRAIAEISRCLRPGGKVVGTTFLSDGSRRARTIFKAGSYRGHPLPPDRDQLLSWLEDAGLAEAQLGPQAGFTSFEARKP